MINVGLFPVGYNTINIKAVCRFLNKAQSIYDFTEGTSIVDLGEPDIDVYGYSDKVFINLLAPHTSDYNYSVIITCAPIQSNFYTRTMLDKIILITTYQSDEVLEKSKRTLEEYLILAISQELISFEFQRVTGKGWEDLFHKDTRGCIFDFAGIKLQKVAKLKTCKICDSCRGKLSTSHINNNIVSAFDKVLLKIKRPSMLKSFEQCILSPVISFLYGGIVISFVINLISSFILSNNSPTVTENKLFFIILSLLILFPLGVYSFDWLKYFKNRLRY